MGTLKALLVVELLLLDALDEVIELDEAALLFDNAVLLACDEATLDAVLDCVLLDEVAVLLLLDELEPLGVVELLPPPPPQAAKMTIKHKINMGLLACIAESSNVRQSKWD